VGIVKAPALAYPGRRYKRLDAANFGGLTDRIRCLLTCSAFSEVAPSVYWEGNWSGEALNNYPVDDARSVFSLNLLPTESLEYVDRPIYDDWLILTPEILGEGRTTAALCIDALNGDGLKSAAMLYQMPDPIYDSLQAYYLQLFSRDYMLKIHRLIKVCRSVRYAVISFRFWRECVPSFRINSFIDRVDVNWVTLTNFEEFCESIVGAKWPRRRPSRSSLRGARELLRKSRIDSIIFMSERWQGASFCVGAAKAISDAVLSDFTPGVERQVANMFVIANAATFVRSTDSTYTHLPILLSDKWSVRILDT
jgi:hypothetical protein